MGLYLAIFDEDEEVCGVEIGRYSDFGYFRDIVVDELENRKAGSKYPTLNLHSDCDGIWSPEESSVLEKELESIQTKFKKLPPVEFNSEWQKSLAKSHGIIPKNLYDCFIDVDGELLIEKLIKLCQISQRRGLPILFQ